MKDGKMTEKELAVFNYVKDNGGKVSMQEIADQLGRTTRSINPNVNAFVANGLATREKELLEGDEKETVYVVLTAEGKAFTPSDAE